MHKRLNFALPYSLYRISRKSETKQNVQLCILLNNNKNITYLQGQTYWSCIYPKRMEFITLYLEITCVYYIELDNRDLQSCQVKGGSDQRRILWFLLFGFRLLGNETIMKPQLSRPELSTSAPYVGNNEGHCRRCWQQQQQQWWGSQ